MLCAPAAEVGLFSTHSAARSAQAPAPGRHRRFSTDVLQSFKPCTTLADGGLDCRRFPLVSRFDTHRFLRLQPFRHSVPAPPRPPVACDTPPPFFGQAFLLAGRWSCLCEYPATAEAAFKVSELAKWPYFFNAAKSLVRDLLQDIYSCQKRKAMARAPSSLPWA